MRISRMAAWIVLLLLGSCNRVHTDLTLDDLEDMREYTGTITVASTTYQGERVGQVLVNGTQPDDPEVLELRSAGYYRIEVYRGDGDQAVPEVIRIVILDPERGETEWGLPPWTPLKQVNGELGEQTVSLIHAPSAPSRVSLPLIVLAGGELNGSESFLEAEIGSIPFRIKRGVGSVLVPEESRGSALRVDHRNFPVQVDDIRTPPQEVSGVLDTDLQIEEGTYLHIPADLTIPEGITMTLAEGCFVTVAPDVNIHNNGRLIFSGSSPAPITVTCSENSSYWGGFIGTANGNRIEAAHTIFSRSGSHTGGDYAYGHAGRQALFYSENGELQLDHCYMTDHIGQVFYPVSCSLELTDCLIQRAKTGGQLNHSELVMDRCVFTDFPDDSEKYRDEDNDGLYLNETNAVIQNSVFMFAKDDGLDSGASGGGEVTITRSIFESVYHEGAALSSGHNAVKLHRITHCLFTNCGQGLELGYSSPNHRVEVDSCRFIANGIGIRYGDCYDSPHHGYILVKNSESLENLVHDVWNMNREHWAADTSHMSFEHVVVSTPYPLYPELIILNNP